MVAWREKLLDLEKHVGTVLVFVITAMMTWTVYTVNHDSKEIAVIRTKLDSFETRLKNIERMTYTHPQSSLDTEARHARTKG